MANPARLYCVCCGKSTSEVGGISCRGYCVGCGMATMLANVHQLREKEGPFADHWAERTAAGVARAVTRSSDSDDVAA